VVPPTCPGVRSPRHPDGRSRDGRGDGQLRRCSLQQLADQGDGFHAYVNGPDEADRLFSEELTGTLKTVALDARAQVEFGPASVSAYRLVGYENRAIADRDFTDDTVEAERSVRATA
jgi:Ca-activated chloride channel family protein